VTSRRAVALIPLLPLVLVACAQGSSTGGGTDPSALQGSDWVLDPSSIAGLVDQVPPGAEITIAFADGRVSGKAACNSYGGDYAAKDDGSMAFGPFAVTLMACDEPTMMLEHAYLATLAGVQAFALDGDLVLTGDGADLRFTSQASQQALSLEGPNWRLTSITSGGTVSSPVAGTAVNALFSADGSVTGSAGCNRYSAPFTASGSSLTFGLLATTKMMCADDVMAQEQAFLTAMGEVAGSSIAGRTLTLVDASGQPVLRFEANG
jgi:heat shock protein HslJ